MQFYSDYTLDLPVRVADRVIERITEHMQDFNASIGQKPVISDFKIPGVLCLDSVVFFQNIAYTADTFEGLSYMTPKEGNKQFDINEKRKTVTFRVWQEILIL